MAGAAPRSQSSELRWWFGRKSRLPLLCNGSQPLIPERSSSAREISITVMNAITSGSKVLSRHGVAYKGSGKQLLTIDKEPVKGPLYCL